MNRIVIAPLGKNIKALFIGLRDFPAHKVILLGSPSQLKTAGNLKKELDKFGIMLEVAEIKGNLWEGMFEIVAKIVSREIDSHIVINTSSGDRDAQCAMTSAAFVNGLKAFSVMGNETMLLPILKFSYYKILTEKKLELLKQLYIDETCCKSLEALSKKTKMSLPLLSYHINGTKKSEGLKSLGLVEVHEHKGKIELTLSTLGTLLIKGYVSSDERH